MRWAILAIAPVTLGACAPNGPPGLPYPDGKPLIPINTAAPEQGSSCQTRAP
ncbi:type IV secretion system protein PtlI [Bordetella pertussis H973]|uniref:hypothetical protein n=1 Tax=Bordetella pertussis TaxID=520 RepID=UPI000318612E|nr:hypothetical protein [Bordetella pertussis]ETH09443.1 type IV secretion system protein PtlI [Bordetella pertussis 2371640]ETH13060.1 type IV secretion system protein PtlI [Bordetella pertussis STO1-SEAT-0006]ETH17612.1 type IV secretion system protein PtlI [Bordetella pertussis STO1-SEAT-0007]ETH52998.1 type IV secretion system protein PtlI [Bordetella pertussis H973]ETH54774.1 type IV secretion system protein PtlI [Bordetella pertussis I002]ETH60783.1 type IV secretion system protein PtlI